MVMDEGSAPYSSYMRLYPDRPDVLTFGTWRRCQPGALLLPVPHAFGSARLRPNDMFDHPLIGEVRDSIGRAIPPYYSQSPGRRFCGDPSLWANGSPLSARGSLLLGPDGTPACCGAPRDMIFGGVKLGGLPAREVIYVTEGTSGGLRDGGGSQAEASTQAEGPTVGGLQLGGLAGDSSAGMDAPTGGLLAGGSVFDASAGMDVVSGGLLIGGVVCDMCINTITVSEQITGGGSTNSVNIGHAASGVVDGTYGDQSHVSRNTYDHQGHCTGASSVAILISAGQVTGLATVATSGAASDLSGLATVATSGSASDLSAGTIPTARLPGGGVNGASELVELTAAGKYPALDGSLLTGLTASQISGLVNQGSGVSQGSEAAPTAAGSSQGTATLLAADNNAVTGADNTKGVLLPATAGARIVVSNTDATHGLKVYPPTGAQISGNGTNNSVVLAASQTEMFCRVSATQWRTVSMS